MSIFDTALCRCGHFAIGHTFDYGCERAGCECKAILPFEWPLPTKEQPMSDEPDCLVIFGGREYRVGGREVPRILEAVKREDALVSIIAKDGRRARVAPHAIVAVEECREEKPKAPGYVVDPAHGGTPIRTAVHYILDLLRALKLTQDEAAQISTYASQRVLP